MTNRRPAPVAAVVHGQPAWGIYDTPFRIVNLEDAPLPGAWNLSRGRLRTLRLKEWQHFAIVHDDWYLTLALVDAKLASTSFLTAYNRRTGQRTEHTHVTGSANVVLPNQLLDGRTGFSHRDYHLRIRNRLVERRHRIELDVAKGTPKAVTGVLTLHEDLDTIRPIVALLPLDRNRPFYTHKVPCPVSGTLEIGGEQVTFDPARHLALVDVHKAYYPLHTTWRWATFAGFRKNGQILGANLTHNVIQDDESTNENALWIGDRLETLSAARFEIPDSETAPWRIYTTDGRVELEFRPESQRASDTRIGPLRSFYRQPFGTYHGSLRSETDEVFDVSEVFGPAEIHEVWW